MLRRDLKVVGNHLSRCNNSGPRNMRENHYAILARLKISYVLKSQDKHNASYFSKMSWRGKTFPSAKLTKIFENESVNPKKCILRYARHGEGESIVIGEFLATDVEGIESVRAVGAMFEQVFLRLGELFAGLILAEAVAPIGDTG